jgi:acylphosphatase
MPWGSSTGGETLDRARIRVHRLGGILGGDDEDDGGGPMERKTVHALISGKVQGVWYRGWTVDRAQALGLSGWVRNRRDGTVEAVFAGPPGAVDAMLAQCREGPPLARVAEVRVTPAADAAEGEGLAGFEQRPTA